MGIDFHGMNFLAYAAKKQPFGATVTIGRQGIDLSNYALRRILDLRGGKRYGPFCEDLLVDRMGASIVESFDNSDYENASFLHDFNRPLVHDKLYDTVIDVGTLEHVFNIPVALKNVSSLCKQGGHILHVLPSNNFSGHGFWQFSPELFFSLYSASNGFSETEIFVAELGHERFWHRVHAPSGGARAEHTSKARSYVLVRTRKITTTTGDSVQQSDYVHMWEQAAPETETVSARKGQGLRSTLEQLPVISALAWAVLKAYRDRTNPYSNARLDRLASGNKHFTRVPISSLVRG